MAGSCFLFASMAALLRYASEVDCYTSAMIRFAIGIAILGAAAMTGRIRLAFVRSRLLFLRGFLGGIGVLLFYLSIQKIGLARATSITYAYPIFAAIGGALFLRERIAPWQWIVILLAFVGIYATATGNQGLGHGVGLYEGLAVLGAVVAGIVVVLIKVLRETESAPAVFCAQSVVGFWIVLVPSQVTRSEIGVTTGLVLVASGLLAAAGQLMMTWSYRHVKVSTGSLLGMLTPVLNVLIAAILFGESLAPVTQAGAVLVLGACGLYGLAEGRGAGVLPGSTPRADSRGLPPVRARAMLGEAFATMRRRRS